MTTYMSRGSREISLNTPLTSQQEILAAGDVYELLARHKDEIAICNCCKDCCILYGSSRDGSISQVFVKSFYSPEMIDEGRCAGCDACGRHGL